MAVLEPIEAGLRPAAVPEVDERAVRRTLREQIARLDRELSAACLGAWPRIDPRPQTPPLRSLAGPRMLTLGELERVRDDLAGRLAAVDVAIAAQAEQQARSRALLEAMLADPPAHKWVRVSNEQLGEPGCKHYHVRPRLGPIGLLMNWWRVKISSGCPLAWGP
jgi:hypothetical protein